MVPPEGFNEDTEDDADFETTRFGMDCIDKLISSLSLKEVMPSLN